MRERATEMTCAKTGKCPYRKGLQKRNEDNDRYRDVELATVGSVRGSASEYGSVYILLIVH